MWSGYVDEWGIKNYAGQIEVVDKLSSMAEVRVTVAGKEAIQDVGGGCCIRLAHVPRHVTSNNMAALSCDIQIIPSIYKWVYNGCMVWANSINV